MERWRQIKDGIELVTIKKPEGTSLMVFSEGKTTCLCGVRNTNDYFWVDYAFNENYIVAYSRGCMVNQIPLKVEAAYDMANKKVIPVTKKNKAIFEYMCIAKKGVHADVILEFLNDNKLDIAETDEVDDFVRYVTAGNVDITREQIVAYILTQYPILEKYMNLEEKLTAKKARRIIEEIGDSVLRFHIMPNILNEEFLN